MGKTATVEVKPEQAEKLILAGQMGKLSLILRSVGKSTEDDRVRDYTTDIETSSALSKLIGRSKAGKAQPGDGAEASSVKSGKAKDNGGGSGPLIINRGGERLAR